MKNLQQLELSGFSGVTDDVVAALFQSAGLDSLTLDSCVSLTSRAFGRLGKQKFVRFSARDLPEVALENIADFLASQDRCLESLELSVASSRLSGDMLRELIAAISGCTKLCTLVLERADFSSGFATKPLTISAALNDLALPNADLRGVPLKEVLVHVNSLKRLDLSSAQLDSKCRIAELATFTSLEHLVLVGAVGISADELKVLIARLPKSTIQR